MANKDFGDTLRELRNKAGFTQQQAADMLGLKNKSTLGSWEVGKSEPDGYTLLKLCKIYDVEDIYIAFGEVNPKSKYSNSMFMADNTSNELIMLSSQEKTLIEKYRTLDERGKIAVETILDSQYNAVFPQTTNNSAEGA